MIDRHRHADDGTTGGSGETQEGSGDTLPNSMVMTATASRKRPTTPSLQAENLEFRQRSLLS